MCIIHLYVLLSLAAPIVRIIPSVKNFILGSFINLTCLASGYPEPHVRWVWSPIQNIRFTSGKSKVVGNNLLIYSAEPEDEGRYDCVATNTAGSQVASAFLNYIGKDFKNFTFYSLNN